MTSPACCLVIISSLLSCDVFSPLYMSCNISSAFNVFCFMICCFRPVVFCLLSHNMLRRFLLAPGCSFHSLFLPFRSVKQHLL
ncbi:hypothetical protein BDV97DRAFT_351953, partial [Delphinella strobiligena]